MLVQLSTECHGVDIDLVYATNRNFTGRAIYRHSAGAYLHPDAAERLARAARLAAELALRVKVLDAFRPAEAQWRLWSHLPDPDYIADPVAAPPIAWEPRWT